jgi:hypothetical protein
VMHDKIVDEIVSGLAGLMGVAGAAPNTAAEGDRES